LRANILPLPGVSTLIDKTKQKIIIFDPQNHQADLDLDNVVNPDQAEAGLENTRNPAAGADQAEHMDQNQAEQIILDCWNPPTADQNQADEMEDWNPDQVQAAEQRNPGDQKHPEQLPLERNPATEQYKDEQTDIKYPRVQLHCKQE
jgi:hypothetical protein